MTGLIALLVFNACGRIETHVEELESVQRGTSDLVQDNRNYDSYVVPAKKSNLKRTRIASNEVGTSLSSDALASETETPVVEQNTSSTKEESSAPDEEKIVKMLEEEEEKVSEKSENLLSGNKNQDQTETKNDKETDTKNDKNAEADPKIEGPGVLKPTIYYFPTINEDEKKCDDKDKKVIHGEGGKELVTVCASTEAICGEQGTCAIIQDGMKKTFNIIGRFQGQDRYFEIKKDGCIFGYGVRSSCLDPFYTLAADLNIYKPGDVIFVPAVEGLELPDGSKHNGYFIIRDQGRGIVGRGRFDFFSGSYHWADSKNPFKKLGLGDVKTNIPYFKVLGESAAQVLKDRSYPRLPAK